MSTPSFPNPTLVREERARAFLANAGRELLQIFGAGVAVGAVIGFALGAWLM
jgi:hypothetical protein